MQRVESSHKEKFGILREVIAIVGELFQNTGVENCWQSFAAVCAGSVENVVMLKQRSNELSLAGVQLTYSINVCYHCCDGFSKI